MKPLSHHSAQAVYKYCMFSDFTSTNLCICYYCVVTWKCFRWYRSSLSFPTGHHNLGITQNIRMLQAAQSISTRSFFTEVLCWTAGVHTTGTSSVWKERILFRGGRLSSWSVLFLQGTTLFLKKYRKKNLLNSFFFSGTFGSLLKLLGTAVTASMVAKSDKQNIFFGLFFFLGLF